VGKNHDQTDQLQKVMDSKHDVRDVLIRVVRIETCLDCQMGLLQTLHASMVSLTLQLGLQPVQPPAQVFPLCSAPLSAAQSQQPSSLTMQLGLQPVQPPAQVFPLCAAPLYAAQSQQPSAAMDAFKPPAPLSTQLSSAATDAASTVATVQEPITSSFENLAMCPFAGCRFGVKGCSAAKSLRHMQTCEHCPREDNRYLHIAQQMSKFERHPRGVVDQDVCCWCSFVFGASLLPDARSRHKTACLHNAIRTLQVGGYYSCLLL
jgi:hypothetical protein